MRSPVPLIAVILVLISLSARADLIVYDSFDLPTKSGSPEKWVSDEPNREHARVSEGSLYYPGLQESEGNRLSLSESTADYHFDFPATDLAEGETIYFSFLVRIEEVNKFGDISPMLRLYDRDDVHGSGVSIGHGSADESTGLMGFSLNNRNRGYGDPKLPRTEENLPIGETYLLIGSYTRGMGAQDGQTALWVNPRQLGGAQPPAPTLSIESYQNDPVWNRLTVRSNGSGSHPRSWSIDEVRIGTSWADVTPIGDTKWIPEPETYALIFGGIILLALAMRRR